MNTVSFKSKRTNVGTDDYGIKPKKHTAAKVIAGTTIALGATAAGLAVGHRTGIFNKAIAKLFNKVVAMAPEDVTTASKFVKAKAKAFGKAMKGLEYIDKAGEFVNKYANDGVKLAKNIFMKKSAV